MRRKVILIGLDGADSTLLKRWTDDGSLPRLRAFMGGCARIEPRGLPPFGNGVFWPSFFTGVGPAKHGRYFREQQAPAAYSWSRVNDDEQFARQPLWQIASTAGRKVAVVDVPNAPLVRNLNGMQLVDWIVHDRRGEMRSWPAHLASEVAERFGTDPNSGTTDFRRGETCSRAAIETLTSQLVWRIGAKRRFSVDLLGQDDWDLVMVGFHEAHDIGHVAWHLHDTGHPLHEKGAGRDPVKEVYVALDEAAGALIDRAGAAATVVVLAGLGMAPKSTGNHLLDGVLRNIEYGHHGRSYLDICRDLYRLLPVRVREKLKPAAINTELAVRAGDRRHRKFYAVPNNEDAGAVRINLKGREPDGKVSAGREYDELCEELSAKLRSLINVDTGEPAVDEVVKVADRFHGPCVDRLPDLFIAWNRSAPIHALRGPGIDQTARKLPGMRTGDHVSRVLALIRGPGIEPGHVDEAVSVMDVSATLAEWLGISIPDADGAFIARFLPVHSGS